jgi:hypothetical protein
MQIQAYLTAAAINLKRLAAALLSIMTVLWPHPDPRSSPAQHHLEPIRVRLVPIAELAANLTATPPERRLFNRPRVQRSGFGPAVLRRRRSTAASRRFLETGRGGLL